MHDDLDLRVIEGHHEADPQYREALRRRVAAILDGSEAPPTDDASPEAATIDLTVERQTQLERHRRWWVVSAVALVGAAAVIAGIVVITLNGDTFAPVDDSVRTTGPSVVETVPTTFPPASSPETPKLFAEIAPGSLVDLPAAPISGRIDTAAVWTGTEMIVWGGLLTDGTRADDGAAFNLADGTWRTIAPAPLSRRQIPAMVWTGTEVLVWGGFVGDDVRAYDGAAYNPTTDTWRLLPTIPFDMSGGVNILSMVWTGDEAVIVGGATTAAYNPVTNSWRLLADPPDFGYPAIWTGDSIIVRASDERMMRYDVAADSWDVVDIPASAALVSVPGARGLANTFLSLPTATGAPTQLLDSAGNQIAELPAFPGAASLFGDHVGATGRWVGGEVVFWIWTGYSTEQVWALNPTTQTWRQLDDALLQNEAVVVAGDVLIAWGNGPAHAMGGVAYRAGR